MDKEELPPKTVKAQLVRLDDNLKQIERKQFAGIQRAPGSLPVLEAFQLFLENERKKAQRKLFIITAIALFSILFSVVTAGLYIRSTLRHADARTDTLAYTTAALQQSLGSITNRQQTSEDRILRTARHVAAQRRILAEQSDRFTTERDEMESEVLRLREQVEALLETQESMQQMLAERPSLRNMTRPVPRLSDRTRQTRPEREEVEQEPSIAYEILTLTPEDRAPVRWMFPTVSAQE